MDNLEKVLAFYVAFLRSLYLIHQNNHWTSSGSNFYSNHLLFERIYKTAQESADLAAEKFVGVFGKQILDINMQKDFINMILNLKHSDDLVDFSLLFEKRFQTLSKKVYENLKENGKLSLGLDDMLLAIASKHEENMYLLAQTK